MKKRIVLFVLAAALLLSPLWGALTIVRAAGDNQSTTTYTGKFTENFENGLDRWQVEKLKDSYIADFTIVDDPDDPGNKVLTHTRNGIYLVPMDEYWPSEGVNAGQLSKVTFRMKFTDNTFGYKTQTGPILSYRDPENFSGTRLNINFNGKTGMHIMSQGMSDGVERGPASGGIAISEFDNSNWFTVTCLYKDAAIEVVMTDSKGVTVSSEVTNYAVDGKFAIGNRYYANNFVRSIGNWYIDDIEVEFAKLSVDKDEVQTDVNVYYSGNTFFKPNETVMITGEQLGKTAGSQVQLVRLPDTPVTAAAADYIGEQNFDNITTHKISWSTLSALGTVRTVSVAQTSDLGIKFIIPEDIGKGIYGVYIPSKNGGEGAVVAINNPEIAFILHNDGDGATPTGWLKMAGSNLSVQDDISKLSAIIIDAQGNRTMVPNNKIEADTTENNDGRDNEYYLQINLSGLNLTPGEYQIMVHNGYGGNYGWSAPMDFTVKATTARSEWEKLGTFDVTDFGAKGDSYTNDTGAIIAAMAAAEANGGGIVYFPACNNAKAFYRITDTIYVPNNVTILGDGAFNTNIFIDTIGNVDMPDAFFYYQQNFAVEGINVYGTVMKTLFQKTNTVTKMVDGERRTIYQAEGGYIYFKDIQTMINAAAPYSNGKGSILEGWDSTTAEQYVIENKRNSNGMIRNATGQRDVFLSVIDVDFYRESVSMGHATGAIFVSSSSDYCYFSNEKNYGYSFASAMEAGMVENCYSSGGSLGPGSGNLLYRNCEFGDSTVNNREIFTTDGHSKNTNQVVQDLNAIGLAGEKTLEDLLEGENLTAAQKQEVMDYIEANRGRVFRTTSNFTWSGTYCRMYITDGQGAGQERRIVEGSLKKIGTYNYFVVENEFVVNPNRNSLVSFYAERVNLFMTNGDFSNGRHVGTYGTLVNSVFDGNRFTNSGSGIEVAPNGGSIWYLTSKDNEADNIMTGHTIFVRAYATGLNAGTVSSSLTFLGIQFRNNQVGNGGYYHVGSAAMYRSTIEVLFEGNETVSDAAAFRNVTLCDGMWLRNNTRYTQDGVKESAYEEALIANLKSMNPVNKYGSAKCVCDEISSTMPRVLGDVNGDGILSNKDVQLIQQHVAQTIVLDNTNRDKAGKTQFYYADLTGDGVVDLKDAMTLMCIIEGTTPPTFAPTDPNAGEEYEEESGGFFPGHW